jgi:hypothetical protein
MRSPTHFQVAYDAALCFPFSGVYKGSGPRPKYGERVDYQHIPERYMQSITVEKGIQTCTYQAQLLHPDFPRPLNVVILVKTNLTTHAWAHTILFSSDLTLSADHMVTYYSLRFQLEFNFRDAKQFWGLEDFMNVEKTAVTNAANLSLFTVNVVQLIMSGFRKNDPDFRVLDLKAYYRGCKYATELIKMLPQNPILFLLPGSSRESPLWDVSIPQKRLFLHYNRVEGGYIWQSFTNMM